MQGILGEKVGMTAIFADDGRQIPVTVIRVAGNQVCGTRTQERDGYSALILGFGEQRVSRVTRPERGFFAANGLVPHVQSQIGLAMIGIGSVAEKAVVREDGLHIAIEVNRLLGNGFSRTH